MHRRTVLASLGAVALAGCLDAGDSARMETATKTEPKTATSTGMDFETRRIRGNEGIIEGGLGGGSDDRYYTALVVDPSDRERFAWETLDAETTAFVEETSFPEEVLLVVQYNLPSLSLELALESVAWPSDGPLEVRAVTTGEYLLEGTIDETIIARLARDGRPRPEEAVVTLVDRDRTFQFRTEE